MKLTRPSAEKRASPRPLPCHQGSKRTASFSGPSLRSRTLKTKLVSSSSVTRSRCASERERRSAALGSGSLALASSHGRLSSVCVAVWLSAALRRALMIASAKSSFSMSSPALTWTRRERIKSLSSRIFSANRYFRSFSSDSCAASLETNSPSAMLRSDAGTYALSSHACSHRARQMNGVPSRIPCHALLTRSKGARSPMASCDATSERTSLPPNARSGNASKSSAWLVLIVLNRSEARRGTAPAWLATRPSWC